jgi:aldehyde:ferredoxin oxidoreductase
MYGWMGRILRINLTDEKIKWETLPEDLARNYIGGNGLGARILWDELKPGIDPLSPENILVFATGPLNGTLWPTSGRLHVMAKGPLSNAWGEGNSGGHFAPYLKFAGYDAIIFEGAAKKPVYLYIDDGIVELRDAKHLWGKDVWETHEILKKEIREDIRTAAIGQAGENLVRMAAIMIDKYAAVARSGLGAVMGSKKLKAIAVYGTKQINLYNKYRFYEFTYQAQRRLSSHQFSKEVKQYGTEILVDLMNEIARYPTRNFQSGYFEQYENLSAHLLKEKYRVRDESCYACPLHCKKYNAVKEGKYKGDGGLGLEYETLNAYGGRIGNSDPEAVIYANALSNKYGLDTDDVGGVIGFMMEIYEKGIIDKEFTGGLELKWGDSDLLIKLINMITFREGIGDLMAEGTHRAALKIGGEALYYDMTVKGVDIPAQDGRAQKSMGLSHVTSNRGADHLTSGEFLSEVGWPDAIVERFEKRAREIYGRSILPEGADRLSPKFKPLMVYDSEHLAALADSMVVCKFSTHWPPVFFFEDLAKAVTYATGYKYSEADMRVIGERIFLLERAFNIREGLSSKDDRLPERFLKEPAQTPPNKGHVVELDEMLSEYYRLRGYNSEGIPSYDRLVKVGLEDVARYLYDM